MSTFGPENVVVRMLNAAQAAGATLGRAVSAMDAEVKGGVASWVLAAALGLGLVQLFRVALRVQTWVLGQLTPSRSPKAFGEWAVVTGCTDGIGLAMAEELARQGMNLVLVSRTQSKLADLAEVLEPKYRIRTKVLAINYAEATFADWARLEAALAGLSVGVLVNNCGMSYPRAMFTEETTDALVSDLIKVNCESLTNTTRVVLKAMLPRKKGCIVNVGSGAGMVYTEPCYSVYAGTKAYVDAFTRSLASECRSRGIRVQCHIPLYVVSKMSKIRRSSLTVPSAKDYAKAAVAALGKDQGFSPTLAPVAIHAFMLAAANAVGFRLFEAMRLPQVLTLRRRGIQKLQRMESEGKSN